nr:CDP-glycerol glycerophosphotransferase family protein [Propionicimonas sp.]
MSRLVDRYRRVLGHLLPRAAVWLLTLVATALLLLGPAVAGTVVAVVALAATVWWRLTTVGADRHLVARAVLVTVAAGVAARSGGWSWPLLSCLAVLLLGLMAEPTVAHATRPALRVSGLPGFSLPLLARVPEPLFLGVSAGATVLTLGAADAALPVTLAAAVSLALLGLAVATYQLFRERTHATERAVRTALTSLGPAYCLYYNGVPHGAYQVRMWLPYLKRTGRSGVLVIRDPRFFATAAALGELPVVLARSVESLEYVAVPSVGAFFYVNNDAKNANGVRFGGITHVHLGHGDSDKPASYSATTAMFDQIFVAGQAGVDRFAQHGVLVPREKFVLVGRPQVEHIEVRRPDAQLPEHPVVLYAPTWRGSIGDSLFGSLRHGERIVAALLAAGATVWFRPHPYSARDAESRVLISRIDTLLTDSAPAHRPSTATAAMTVFECMNGSDVLVTDVSSVASDYLYSNKPFAITDTGVVADLVAEYPVARAAVLLPVADGDLTAAVADLLGPDSRRQVRAETRGYYLGDWPPGEYADVFVTAAARAMTPAS